jgi:uncharacterized lipoprotein YajG
MSMARLASTSVLIALLAACDAPPKEQAATPAADTAQQDPKQAAKDTVFGDMVGTMDKARTVEDTAAQRQREVQQAVEEAEGK